jgi:hypothetical protein
MVARAVEGVVVVIELPPGWLRPGRLGQLRVPAVNRDLSVRPVLLSRQIAKRVLGGAASRHEAHVAEDDAIMHALRDTCPHLAAAPRRGQDAGTGRLQERGER